MECSGPTPTQPHLIRLRRLGRQPRSASHRTRPHRPWGPHRTRRITHPNPAPAGQPGPHRIPPGHPRTWRPPSFVAAPLVLCQPTLQLPTADASAPCYHPICRRPRHCSGTLLHHLAWHRTAPRNSSCHCTPPTELGGPWPHLSHTSSTSRPLGILGRCHPRPPATSAHHRSDPPPTTPEPNRTSPPSRHRSSKFIDNTWMGTTWMDSPHGTQTTSTTTAHPRRTQRRARMAAPSGHRHPHQLPSRTPRKHRSSQPCPARIPFRPARQQSIHNHPQQPRDDLPFPPLQIAAPSTSSTPTSPDQPLLPVPSRSWPLWRPPCSLCPSRDFMQSRRPPRASSSPNVQGSRSEGDHQHQNHWPQHWPRSHPRRQANWGHCQRPPTVGSGATCGWHNLGFPPHTSREPTHAGRTIQRHSSKGREAEQGTHLPRAAGIQMASIVRADMPGDWPVKQSSLLNVLRSKRRGKKYDTV